MGRYQDLPNRTDVYYADDSTIQSAGQTICRQRRVCAFTGGLGYPTYCAQASCCYQFVVPEGVNSIVIEAWGAGGAGGSAGDCCCCQATPGGGGGGYASITVPTVPGCPYTVCVGGGGASAWGMVCQNGLSAGGTSFIGGGNCGCSGGITFVTGYNLQNFCVTPGCGGCAGCNTYLSCNGTNQCNYGCGWASALAPGVASSGGLPNPGACAVTTRGMGGTSLGCSSSGCRSESYGGNAGGPGGGQGGYRGWMNCCRGYWPSQAGFTPGGGGSAMANVDTCSCCNCGGFGAPGLVKIWY